MRRYSTSHLSHWHQKKNRLPLIIRGARQVGKSSLVRLFAQEAKLDLIELNLERTQKLSSLYEPQFEIQSLLDEIQLLTKKKITPNSLIFFDEIQENPKLLQMLRYFQELKPELAVISAGSLLEFTLLQEDFSFPVGRVEFYHLGPMTFFEFLTASGRDDMTHELSSLKISSTLHTLSLEYLKKYFYVGGMPKAVLSFAETQSLVETREVQSQILQTYSADFPKYNRKIDVRRIENIFIKTTQIIGQKLIYQKLDTDSRSRDIKRIIELLIQARVVLPVIHTDASGLPLSALSDSKIMKLYFLDIGLLNAAQNLEWEMLQNDFNGLFLTKGSIAEQFVAQHLAQLRPKESPELFYWLRDKNPQRAEVDFIIQHQSKIFPVEVKADKNGKLRSLIQFVEEKGTQSAIKISTAPLKKEDFSFKKSKFQINQVPLYLIEKLLDIIA